MIYYVSKNKQLFQSSIIVEAGIESVYNWLDTNNIIGFDTETTGFSVIKDGLLCYQIGNRSTQYVIDSGSFPIELFSKYFEDSNKLFILQNFKFDGRFLLKHNVDIWKMNIFDTFLAECLLTTGLITRGLGLDDIVWKYCSVKLDKSIRGEISRIGLSSKVIQYAADDVVYLEDVMNKQIELLKEHSLMNVMALENNVVKVFTLMEYHGVKLNVSKWNEVIVTVNAESVALEDSLNDVVLTDSKFKDFRPKYTQMSMFDYVQAKTDINWASNQQKLAVCQKIDSSMQSVGDRELQRIKSKHPLVKTLISYNKYKKLQSSFGKKFLDFVDVDGRIRANIWQILSTGRISVSEPNLNQIPSKGELAKVIRSCFIPEPGYKIVGGDYSGMELRIIAEFSKDPVWLNAFKDGQDLHSVLCAMTFDIPIEDVKKETPFKKGVTYRDIQKTISFGLAYGMSEFKLADTMDIPVAQAKAIIDKFFKAVPKVEKFLTGLGNLGKARGYIKSSQPFSRIRWFEQWQHAVETKDFKILGEIERASKNTPIQGTNGDIIKQALIDVQEEIYLNNWDVKIILAVYDEIQTECVDSQTAAWKIKLDELMVTAAKKVLKDCPVVVDCSINEFWQK
jgi:DNA polymerase-1